MPFDNVKTFLQKHNIDLKDGGKEVRNIKYFTIRNAFKHIYKTKGLFGFFTGYRVRLCIHFINAGCTVVLLEWLDNIASDIAKFKERNS